LDLSQASQLLRRQRQEDFKFDVSLGKLVKYYLKKNTEDERPTHWKEREKEGGGEEGRKEERKEGREGGRERRAQGLVCM
jgi:hypothetical protein